MLPYFYVTDLTPRFLAEEKQSICVGETVVFTCSVTGPGILTWGIDLYVNIQNPIRFRLRDGNVKVGHTFYGSGGLYNATVTSVSPDPVNNLLGNLSSELHIVVEPGRRIEVQCGDDTTGSQTVIMPPAGTLKDTTEACVVLYIVLLCRAFHCRASILASELKFLC